MSGFNNSIGILSHLRRVFGLNVSPVYRSGKVNDVSKKSWCRIGENISLFWLLYALLLHITHLILFNKTISFTINYKVSILDFGLDMMFTLVGAMGMIVTIIWSLKNTSRLRSLKMSMESFDQRFKMFGRNVDSKLTRSFAIWEMVAVMLFWAFYLSYYVFWNCDYGTLNCFRNWFVTYHPHKTLLVAFMEEIALLYGLSVRFRCLNDMLINMEMDNVVDLNFRYLPFTKVNPSKTSVPAMFKSSKCTKIVHCRELHYFLCDLASDLNDMFSLQTVVNILDCFVNIFVMLYLACFGYSRDVENSTANYNPLGIFLPLTVGGEAFTKIYYLAKYCQSVQFEAKRTGEILHKISMYSLDENVKNEILHFSHQVLHKNVRITACGMFPIDFSLVYNVVAAVTTFIVILIQFAMAIKYSPPTVISSTVTDVTVAYNNDYVYSVFK